MKKYFIFYFCFLLYSCSYQYKIIKVDLNDNIKKVIDSLMIISPPNNVYELYVDKIDPQNCNMLFYIGSKPLTEIENKANRIEFPLLQTVLRKKTINIYSGVEKYVKNPKEKYFIKDKKERTKNDYVSCIYWEIQEIKGKFLVRENDIGYPFIPFPLKNEKNTFSQPKINE